MSYSACVAVMEEALPAPGCQMTWSCSVPVQPIFFPKELTLCSHSLEGQAHTDLLRKTQDPTEATSSPRLGYPPSPQPCPFLSSLACFQKLISLAQIGTHDLAFYIFMQLILRTSSRTCGW